MSYVFKVKDDEPKRNKESKVISYKINPSEIIKI